MNTITNNTQGFITANGLMVGVYSGKIDFEVRKSMFTYLHTYKLEKASFVFRHTYGSFTIDATINDAPFDVFRQCAYIDCYNEYGVGWTEILPTPLHECIDIYKKMLRNFRRGFIDFCPYLLDMNGNEIDDNLLY